MGSDSWDSSSLSLRPPEVCLPFVGSSDGVRGDDDCKERRKGVQDFSGLLDGDLLLILSGLLDGDLLLILLTGTVSSGEVDIRRLRCAFERLLAFGVLCW